RRGRHLRDAVREEEQLPVARPCEQRELRIGLVLDDEARVLHGALTAYPLEVALPALAVGRIREHEVELARRERVVRERRVLRSADDVVGSFALAFQQEVGLRDGVGFGIDLLAVEVRGNLLIVLPRALLEGL